MSLENRNALCPGYAKRAPPSPAMPSKFTNDRDIHRGSSQFSLAERIESDRHGRSSDSRSSGFAHLPGFPVVLSGPSLLQQWELSQTCTAFPFQYKRITISCYMKLWIQYTPPSKACQYVSNGAECSLLTEPSGNRHIPFPPAHRRICSSPPVTGEPIKYKKSRVESSHRRSPPFSFRPGCAIIPSYTFSASGQTPSG